jgi:hypothetical protein
MHRSLKKLRPKANKLFSFSAHWKRSNKELNIELGQQILALSQQETFPKAIQLFFTLPEFKSLLKNLSHGSMWKSAYVFTDEDHHPPQEIQKIQTLTSAFQKLCSISYFPNYPIHTLAKAQLLVETIHQYLLVIYSLQKLPYPASKKIQKDLFSSIHMFIKELLTLSKEKDVFKNFDFSSHLKLLKKSIFSSVTAESLKPIHEIIASLSLCCLTPPLGKLRKILNQMHGEIELSFDSIAKNAPFSPSYRIKKTIHEILLKSPSSEALLSELESLFHQCSYKIIETKQKSHSENLFEATLSLHILQKSLEKIALDPSIPEHFFRYYHFFYLKVQPPLGKLESFNSQIGYFLSGFFQTQISYLLELINNPPIDAFVPIDLSLFNPLIKKIISFLHTYAKIKPELLQEDIRLSFTHPTIKNLPLNEAKNYIQKSLSLFFPESDENILILLEKLSRTLLTDLLKIYKSMDPKSFAATLLKEKIKGLYLIDLPSFHLGWFLFGEIVSVLYILTSLQHVDSSKTIENFLIETYHYPIFSVLLNAKSSTLPDVLIKLQTI